MSEFVASYQKFASVPTVGNNTDMINSQVPGIFSEVIVITSPFVHVISTEFPISLNINIEKQRKKFVSQF